MMSDLLTKKQWEVKYQDFCQRHCWLDYQNNFSAAPGWIVPIDQCLNDLEEVLEPVGLENVKFFGLRVRDARGKEMGIYVDFDEFIGSARLDLCKDIVRHTLLKLEYICCKCGGVIDEDKPVYVRNSMMTCEAHADFEGVFAEEFFDWQTAHYQQLCDQATSDLHEDEPEVEGFDVNENLDDSSTDEASVDTRPCLKIFDLAELKALSTDKSADRNANQRRKELVGKMERAGEMRKFCEVPAPDTLSRTLKSAFPNFAEVVDFIACYVGLAKVNGKLRLPPILLEGPAGIGKTAFASALARLLDTGYIEVHMENEQNNATLAGASEYWGNSQTGVIFDVLVFGKSCNPLVVVDEVDKAAKRNDYNPIAPLYQLLERETAKRFHDLALRSVGIDASYVMWIMTANDVSSVDQPILSRMKRFDIKPPTPDQAERIAKKIYVNVLERNEWTALFSANLPKQVAKALSEYPPRQIQAEIEAALGRAAKAGRRSLTLRDIGVREKQPQRGIGFVWNDGRQA